MGNGASADGTPQTGAPPTQKIEVKKKDDKADATDKEAKNEKAPTLTYLSCMKVFDLGNVFTKEVSDRKLKDFPMGKQPSNEWIFKQMEREWLHSGGEDCSEPWNYVTNPVPQEKEKRLDCWGLERDKGNEGMTVKDFAQRPIPKKACLAEHEVLSLRLYTGPGYKPLNTSLRKVEMRFAITARVISIAIVKIAEVCGRAPRCYRGMSIDLADDYKEYYRKMTAEMLVTTKPKPKKSGGLGILGKVVDTASKVVDTVVDAAKHNWERVEGFAGPVPFDPAPLSFTTKLDVVNAFTYGKETGIKLCFIEKSMCRKETPVLKIGIGADVDWVSQYPTEAEVLFPPFTAMLPYALEHRDMSDAPEHKKKDVAALCGADKQYCFMPVTYCCWNTQWDREDFQRKCKADNRAHRATGG